MTKRNIKYFFKKLKAAKIKFHSPSQKKIMIYGHGYDQFEFLKKEECCVFHENWEEINIFILFKTVLRKGFKNIKRNYKITFIQSVNPKYIFSYRCDNKSFYELKNHLKNVKTILIQWGKTIKEHFKNFKNDNNSFNIDEMYLYGEETAKKFSEFIVGKTFSIGSIANNRFSFHENVKSNSLTFISQAKSGRVLPEIEKIILKFLKDYCLKNNLLLGVSTRVRPDDLLGKEKYTNILGDKNWIYFPRRKPNVYGDYEAYGKVMLSEYIVSIDSTLGYEAISRKKKVVFFPLGAFSPEWCRENYVTDEKKSYFYIPSKFGYPLNFEREGEFWLSDFNEKKMGEKLNFILNINHEEWKNLLDQIGLKKIINFDLHNKILLNNLKNLGVPLQKDKLMR